MSPVPTDAFFAVVPASSANVGCAFDSAAIALGLYLRVSAAPKESGWELSYSGANADQILHDRTNLFVKAMERAAAPQESGNVLIAKADVSANLDFVAVVPEVPLPTEKARAVLPAQYSRRDVVANLQRTAVLAARFFSGGELSPELFRDALHQPYRSPLVPGIAECLAFRHAGLAGVFLSGAGSAVMAIARHSAAEIGDALVAEFGRNGTPARALLLKADNRGARISSGDLPTTGPARSRFTAQKT